MTDYLTNDIDLTSVADAIRDKGGTTEPLEYPSEFVSAIEAFSGSSWVHLAHEEYTVSTTSTTASSVGTITLNDYRAFNAAQFLYVRVRDTAGVRAGYYAGGDTFITNIAAALYTNSSVKMAPTYVHYTTTTSSVSWTMNTALSTSAYGVFPRTFSRGSAANMTIYPIKIDIYARYNSSNTKTIDGTFAVDVFALSCPDGYPTICDMPIDGSYQVIVISSNYGVVDKTTAEAGDTVTFTAKQMSGTNDVNIYANIGDGESFQLLLASPSVGDTATFTMPSRTVRIIAVMNEEA